MLIILIIRIILMILIILINFILNHLIFGDTLEPLDVSDDDGNDEVHLNIGDILNIRLYQIILEIVLQYNLRLIY